MLFLYVAWVSPNGGRRYLRQPCWWNRNCTVWKIGERREVWNEGLHWKARLEDSLIIWFREIISYSWDVIEMAGMRPLKVAFSSRDFCWNAVWQGCWSSCVRSSWGHLITAASWIGISCRRFICLSCQKSGPNASLSCFLSSSLAGGTFWHVPGVPLEGQTSWQMIQWWPLPHRRSNVFDYD